MPDDSAKIMMKAINALPADDKERAQYACALWRSAIVQAQVGLGPMETRSIYHDAYETLADLGVDVGGMVKPYRGA